MHQHRRQRRKNTARKSKQIIDYWMSYSDLMSGLLLVFIILLVGTMLISKQEMQAQTKKLNEQLARQQKTDASLKNLEDGLDDKLGVRASLLSHLEKEFMASGSGISFDSATGAVRLDSLIVFEHDADELKPHGQEAIKTAMEIYLKAILSNPIYRDSIEQIIFEGHTNSNYSGRGSAEDAYLYNLELSQRRAYSAMEYVIKSGIAQKYDAKNLLAAIGLSNSQPILTDGLEDAEKSRRLEIKFRLKDKDAMDEMVSLFKAHQQKQKAAQ